MSAGAALVPLGETTDDEATRSSPLPAPRAIVTDRTAAALASLDHVTIGDGIRIASLREPSQRPPTASRSSSS